MRNQTLCAGLLVLLVCSVALADLHDPANHADYLIVTPASVLQDNPWISQLAQWRNAHGRTAMVIPSDSIYTQFGNGSPSDSTLKDFLLYAYRHWSAPQLKDVFIIGWHDLVPSHVQLDSMFSVHDSTGDHYSRYFYLNDFQFTTDPDSANHLPLFSIGRLPWSPSNGELWDYYTRVQGYESVSGEAWQHQVQLIADDSDAYFDFANDFAESLAARIHTGYTVERDYADYPAGDPWAGPRAEIIGHLMEGNYLTMYTGHGGAGVWSPRMNLDALTFDSLTNGSRLPIVCGYSYDAGMNGNYVTGPIAVSLTSNPHGGAIGYFGSTANAWAYNGLELRQYFAGRATSDSVRTLGDLWRLSLDSFIRSRPDEQWIVSGFTMTIQSFMLFGDPGVRLPARPQSVTEQTHSLNPSSLSLSNSPNPFNAMTRIQFDLPQNSAVRLRVMNILGQEIITLVSGPLAAGYHDIAWNSRFAPSGLYFAVLDAGGVQKVKKMMLLK
jgi:hypothetical protein